MNQPTNYDELCTLVGTIDKSAEKYMRGDAKRLPYFEESGKLSACFAFFYTSQGHYFWVGIMNKIGQESI
jgi:hypothetical protein